MVLTASDLLGLWERTAGLHPIDSALEILSTAHPKRDPSSLARLPLGERDAMLLRVRQANLGNGLDARDRCPECGDEVEVSLSCADLIAGRDPDGPGTTWILESGGYRMTLRSVDSLDAAAAARSGELEAARTVLLERVVLDAERDGAPVSSTEIPSSVAEAISASLSEHDPVAELELGMRCPACGHQWTELLDVPSFVHIELADRGRRVLTDVDLLARAYGWSEPDILALDDARRAAYIAMVQG